MSLNIAPIPVDICYSIPLRWLKQEDDAGLGINHCDKCRTKSVFNGVFYGACDECLVKLYAYAYAEDNVKNSTNTESSITTTSIMSARLSIYELVCEYNTTLLDMKNSDNNAIAKGPIQS